MTKVLMDDSSLNAIANSIRRKNGLVRTYKPREMAPAIRAFQYFLPSSHEYRVSVIQSEHQYITVRKYLNYDWKDYTKSFTVSEPYYLLDIQIEADPGWIPGTLNYQNPITLDRDILIQATPATQDVSENVYDLYLNGSNGVSGTSNDLVPRIYTDEECTKGWDRGTVGKIRVHDLSPTPVLGMQSAFGSRTGTWLSAAKNITDIEQYINVSQCITLDSCFYACALLKSVNLSNWNPNKCEHFNKMFADCGRLQDIGDISHWGTDEVISTNNMFSGCRLKSVDLSGWTTPKLEEMTYMFSESTIEVIDISGWNTSAMKSTDRCFYGCNRLKYVIINDDSSVKFNGEVQLWNPGSSVKFLVPSSIIEAYRQHSNWQGRTFDEIEKYTITRYNGKIEVKLNPY